MYYIYEHWLFGQCIYVGSGDKNRPNDFLKNNARKRNKYWQDISKNIEDKIEIKIVGKTKDKSDALKIETFWTMYRFLSGSPLTNQRIGDINKKGKYSPMYGRKFSKSQIENIRLAQIEYTKKHGSQFKGKHHTEENKKILSEKSKGNKNASSGVEAINTQGDKIYFNSVKEAELYFREIIGRNSFRRIINENQIPKDLETGWKIKRLNPRSNAI